jgi:Tfp pilus assembly protein PilF
MGRATIAAAALAALAGCAEMQGFVQATKAQVRLVEGLKLYDMGEHAQSTANLQEALDTGLNERDQANARKHLAFIHCSSNRERQCRDEFRKALAADPALQLSAAEAGHPVWGPIFLSLSGNSALSAGLKQYESGAYAESAKNLQNAISLGLPEKQRANAHKHLAFIHCSSNRERQCRDEFRKALAVDPALELAPAEAGHPVWGPIFRSVKAGR